MACKRCGRLKAVIVIVLKPGAQGVASHEGSPDYTIPLDLLYRHNPRMSRASTFSRALGKAWMAPELEIARARHHEGSVQVQYTGLAMTSPALTMEFGSVGSYVISFDIYRAA
jgi:hypothetical protein